MTSLVLHLPRLAASVAEARAFVRSALAETGIADGHTGDLLVAVSEACSNVVSHASGSESLHVEVTDETDRVRIVVSDHGAGFDAPGHTSMPEPDENRGRGLALIDELCDDVAIESGPAGTRIDLVMATGSERLPIH